MKRTFVLASLVTGLVVASTAAFAWEVPAKGPVIDQWGEPAHRYAPGNRGVDLDTSSDPRVEAAGPGTVSFAGLVAGTRYVVIDHGNGLRTTYGNLDAVHVAEGQRVVGATHLGDANDTLHFGVREGSDYLDPNSLYGSVSLVPVGEFRSG